jgi:hypothetical protein
VKRYTRARTNEERRRRTIAALPWGIGTAVGLVVFVTGVRLVTGHDPAAWALYPVVVLVVAIGLFVEWREGTRGQ